MGNLFLDLYLVFSVIATIASAIWLIVLIRNKPIKRYSVIRDVSKRPKPVRAFGESETRLPFTLKPGESVEFLLDANQHNNAAVHKGIVDDVLDVKPTSTNDSLMKPLPAVDVLGVDYKAKASEKKTDCDDILERHRRDIANGVYGQDIADRYNGYKSSGNDTPSDVCNSGSGSSSGID